jgi:hypothetical protein
MSSRIIARATTFPLKKNNQIKSIEGLSEKDRRAPVLSGGKREIRAKMEKMNQVSLGKRVSGEW